MYFFRYTNENKFLFCINVSRNAKMRIKKTKQTIKTNSPRRRGKKGWEEKNKKEDNTNEIDQVKKRGKKGVWAVKMGDKRRGWEGVYKKGGEKGMCSSRLK